MSTAWSGGMFHDEPISTSQHSGVQQSRENARSVKYADRMKSYNRGKWEQDDHEQFDSVIKQEN